MGLPVENKTPSLCTSLQPWKETLNSLEWMQVYFFFAENMFEALRVYAMFLFAAVEMRQAGLSHGQAVSTQLELLL